MRRRTVSVAADGMTAYADVERVAPLPVTVVAVPSAVRAFTPAPTPYDTWRILD